MTETLPQLPDGFSYGQYFPADRQGEERIEIATTYIDPHDEEVAVTKLIPISTLLRIASFPEMVQSFLLLDGQILE